MPNKTNRYAKKTVVRLADPVSLPLLSTVVRLADPVSLPLAAPPPESNPSHGIFKANLPMFYADIRGNVASDPETFVSKAGKPFTKFRIAYTRKNGETKNTMFIQVICEDNGEGASVNKGDYIRIAGAYHDDGVSQGNENYDSTVFRTLFHNEEDPFEVLIAKKA